METISTSLKSQSFYCILYYCTFNSSTYIYNVHCTVLYIQCMFVCVYINWRAKSKVSRENFCTNWGSISLLCQEYWYFHEDDNIAYCELFQLFFFCNFFMYYTCLVVIFKIFLDLKKESHMGYQAKKTKTVISEKSIQARSFLFNNNQKKLFKIIV